MVSALLCCAFLAWPLLVVGQPVTYISASSPLVLWQGRPSASFNNSYSFDWESTSATVAVSGVGSSVNLYTNITLPAGSSARVAVYVNQIEAANLMLESGTTSYMLASSLPKAVNNVTIAYVFEPDSSQANAPAGRLTSFVGFGASNGGAFVAPAPLSRRIDIIGDSITAGSAYDRVEAVGGPLSIGELCDPWAPATGYSQGYNWETYLCRYFFANCTTTAWSGKGLIENSGCSAGPLMPQLYTQAFATDAASVWDFSRAARPDAVIVFLGTNDYSCANTTDAAFTAAYVQFLLNITSYYAPSKAGASKTHFFCAIGAMSPTRPLNALLATIAQAQAAGISASLLDMRNVTLDGCGGHPGPEGHWQMALAAAPQIKATMGW